MKEMRERKHREKNIRSRLGRRGISLLLAFGLFISAFSGIVFIDQGKEAKAAKGDVWLEYRGKELTQDEDVILDTDSLTIDVKIKTGLQYTTTTTWTLDPDQENEIVRLTRSNSNCNVKALKPGHVHMTVIVEDATVGEVLSTTVDIEVKFGINTNDDGTGKFRLMYPDDEKNSLVLRTTDTAGVQLGLNYQGISASDVVWSVTDEEISGTNGVNEQVSIGKTTGLIRAVGAGKTKVSAVYTQSVGKTFTAYLDVYVIPQSSKDDGGPYTSNPDMKLKSGEYIYFDANFSKNLQSLDQKVAWVIEHDEIIGGIKRPVEIVNSYKGLYSDIIRFNYVDSHKNQIEVSGISGEYRVSLYAYDSSHTTDMDLAAAKSSITLTIKSGIEDKYETLGIDDSLNLAENYNMTADDFNDSFSVTLTTEDGTSADLYASNDTPHIVVGGPNEGKVIATMTVRNQSMQAHVKNLMGLPQSAPDVGPFKTMINVVRGLSLDAQTLTLFNKQTHDFTATLLGASGLASEVQFKSGDDNYVSWERLGSNKAKITAKKVTTKDIPFVASVQGKDGITRTATCMVKVLDAVSKFKLSEEGTLVMNVGNTPHIVSDIDPSVTDAPLSWTSSNEEIFKVEPTGDHREATLKALKGGKATLIVINTLSGERVDLQIDVRVPVTDIKLSAANYKFPFYQKGHNMKDELTVSPTEAASTKLTWEVDDTSIATIDDSGFLTFKAPGNIVVTAHPEYNPNSKFANAQVKITGGPDEIIFENIKDGALTLESGKTFTVNYKFVPETAETGLKIYMSKEGICTIQPNEKKKQLIILGKDPGTTTVSVKTDDNIYYSFTVTVTKGAKSVSFKDGDKGITLYRGDPNKESVDLSKLVQVDPKDATDTLSYGTLDKDSSKYIKVDAKTGVVTAVAATPAGGVYATATTSSNYTGAIKIIVVDQVTEINQDSKTKRVKVGETITITPIIVPDTAGNKKIKWSWEASEGENTKLSLVEKITEVEVTGEEVGTALLTGVSEENNKIKVVYIIKVVKKGSSSINYKTVVKLSPETKYVDVGKNFKVHRKVTGAYKGNKTLAWKSSNKKVATVSKQGRVKTKKVGKATITATAQDGSKAKGKMKVVVERVLKSIKMSRSTATILIGESLQLGVSYTPANATVKGVKWSSSDAAIASVNGGKVIGIAKGIVKITATSKDRTKKKCHCWVTVSEPQPVSSFTITDAAITVAKGKSVQSGIVPNPSNTTDSIQWWSDNTSVATVNNRGKITTHNVGQATIYARAANGVEGHVDVTVVDLNRKAVTLRQYDKEQLSVNQISEGVTWYSADPSIAKVDESGMVTGQMPGTTIVYANVDGVKLGCRVTVTRIT